MSARSTVGRWKQSGKCCPDQNRPKCSLPRVLKQSADNESGTAVPLGTRIRTIVLPRSNSFQAQQDLVALYQFYLFNQNTKSGTNMNQPKPKRMKQSKHIKANLSEWMDFCSCFKGEGNFVSSDRSSYSSSSNILLK